MINQVRTDTWAMRGQDNAEGTKTVGVYMPTMQGFIHDGKLCDGIVVSLACTPDWPDIEVLATSEGHVVSAETLVPHLEQDDLLLILARALAEEVSRERF